MPTTIATAVVLALGIIPGATGAYAWAIMKGVDWREKDWETGLRYLTFSALGLALYVLLAIPFDLLPPVHVVPSTYTDDALHAARLAPIALPYIAHIVCAGIVAAAAASLDQQVCKWTGTTRQPSTWDYFLQESVPERWAVVTLKSGDVFAGYIASAESSAPAGERDVVLNAPARRDPDSGNYIVSSYHALFCPAELVQSIGVMRADGELQRIAVGTSLFQGVSNGREVTESASAAFAGSV